MIAIVLTDVSKFPSTMLLNQCINKFLHICLAGKSCTGQPQNKAPVVMDVKVGNTILGLSIYR